MTAPEAPTQAWPGKHHSVPGEQVRATKMPGGITLGATDSMGTRSAAFISFTTARQLGQWLIDNSDEEEAP